MTDGVAVTKRELEFEAACRTMLSRGVKPTPANLDAWRLPLGDGREVPGFGNGRTIRGNYVRIRTRLLKEAGYVGGGAPGSRWIKP